MLTHTVCVDTHDKRHIRMPRARTHLSFVSAADLRVSSAPDRIRTELTYGAARQWKFTNETESETEGDRGREGEGGNDAPPR